MARQRTRRGRIHSQGQALVEMALVAPFLVMLTFGVSDGGRAFYYQEGVFNGVRQALRISVSAAEETNNTPGDQACTAVGGSHLSNYTATGTGTLSGGVATTSANFMTDIANATWLENSSNGTVGQSVLNPPAGSTTLTVTWHCTAGGGGGGACTGTTCKAMTQAGATSTDPTSVNSAGIKVAISFPFQPLTSALSGVGFNTLSLHNSAYGQAEY